MKTPIPTKPMKTRIHTLLTLAALLIAGLAPTHAAAPAVQTLLPGKWPAFPRGGGALDIKVVGNYAYVALEFSGLGIFDVSNPANPVQVGSYKTPFAAVAVDVSGNHAYVLDARHGLQVVDVSNPGRCVRRSSVNTGDYGESVLVSGNYAYVADQFTGFSVVDVSNPTNCVRRGDFDTSGYADGVAVVQ